MSTLYEIDRAIMNCCNQETGEMIDQEALDALMMQRTEKLESVALWIKNLPVGKRGSDGRGQRSKSVYGRNRNLQA